MSMLHFFITDEQREQQGRKKRAEKKWDRCSDPSCGSKYNGGECKTLDPPGQYRKSPSKKINRKQFICRCVQLGVARGVNKHVQDTTMKIHNTITHFVYL